MKKKQKPRPIRVMLVDDHAGLRRALRAIIDSQPDLEVVAEADGGLSALQLYQRATPDIVLMDGSMPDMSGVEATHRLKQLQPEARIIGLSLYDIDLSRGNANSRRQWLCLEDWQHRECA